MINYNCMHLNGICHQNFMVIQNLPKAIHCWPLSLLHKRTVQFSSSAEAHCKVQSGRIDGLIKINSDHCELTRLLLYTLKILSMPDNSWKMVSPIECRQ